MSAGHCDPHTEEHLHPGHHARTFISLLLPSPCFVCVGKWDPGKKKRRIEGPLLAAIVLDFVRVDHPFQQQRSGLYTADWSPAGLLFSIRIHGSSNLLLDS
ncbi:hypothetical protein PVAP13_2KG026732 [Panicum virgatum]|uniref:Uncharacterized protein n=1 Tax=Panicum virgatum TaxID=38727 RepID=A0A8T0W550_PANVG|nr:hypothetical protein PVAP13_2KG026732 [Panicum virgatum]